MSVIEVAQTAGKINEHIEETGITRKDERRCNVPEITLRVAMEQWNAPTEAVHLLGNDYPVFRRTKRWLESERNPKILCCSCDRLVLRFRPYYQWREEYGGMIRDQLKRLKELDTENQRLKRFVADLSLEKMILTEAARGNF